jgi:vancomycin resistance protein VanJ
MDSPTSKPPSAAEGGPQLRIAALLISLWKICRAWVFGGTLLIVACVLGLALLIRYRAESNLLSIFLSYLPAWVMVLPLLATLLISILFVCWRSAVISSVCAALLVLWLGGYTFTQAQFLPQESAGSSLTVLTYNRGQGSEKVLASCTAHHQPDIVALQDAGRRLTKITAQPEFALFKHSFQDGEYILLSRWPVVESQGLELSWPVGKTGYWRAGTRSVIDWNGRRVVIYNMHFPTPRDMLYWYARRGTFLYGVIGLIPHTSLHAHHQQCLAYWSARVQLAAQVAARVRAETEPVVVLGDLNAPPLGQAYSQFTTVLQDTHQAAGNGFGFTFPGNFKSIGRFVAPWIRIDHIFASTHWEILSCAVPSGEVSQHLPVKATMKIKPR